MKRFHVHIAVRDLEQSTAFYASLFGAPPSVQKPGYAKWMLDDPRINFAISPARGAPGLEHLGVQVDSDAELAGLRQRMARAGSDITDEEAANCCYAVSDKHWTVDPQGIAWEAFHTLAEAQYFGEDRGPAREAATAACCTPRAAGCC